MKIFSWINPWFYFTSWVFLNSLLSYTPLPPALKAVFFILIFLSFLAWLFSKQGSSSPRSPSPWKRETLPSISPWIWFLVIGLGLFLRFYKLKSLSFWPNLDEGRTSLFAIEQDFHWDWKLLYGFNQLPPLFYWLDALFFKVFPPSLFSLWLFPTLLSTLTLGLGWGAARLFFSRSFSFLAVAGLALAFWPLYEGRFSIEPVLIPCWELAALLGLGLFRKKPSLGTAALLGVLMGTGFYVHLHWAVIALMVSLAFFWTVLRPGPGRQAPGLWTAAYLVPCLLVVLPLALAVFHTRLGDYLGHLLVFKPGGRDLPGSEFVPFSYLSALFWGIHLDYFAYKPYWGGLWNPLWGALVFLGLGGIWKNRQDGMALWLLGAIPLFLLLGFLTNNVETYRIIPLLPLLLATAVLGLQILLESLAIPKRVLFLTALFLLSSALDSFHLFGAYPAFWTSGHDHWAENYKTYPFYKAFQTLEPSAEKESPCALLFSTRVAPNDPTLVAATYPFSPLFNSRLGTAEVLWVAFFQWEDEDGYLSRRFPASTAVDLDLWPENLFQGVQWIHGIRLRLVPVDASNRALFTRWVEADRCLEQADFLDLNRPDRHSSSTVVQMFLNHRPLFEKDPLLESFFWEKLADYEEEENNNSAAMEYLRHAVRFGVSRASTYHRLAVLEVKNRQYGEAYRDFLQAGRLSPVLAPPAGLLKKLREEMEK